MSNDRFLRAIVDILRDHRLDHAITCALELLVDLSGAASATVELHDAGDVVFTREYRSIFAGHPAFTSVRVVRRDIGVPALGHLAIVAPVDSEAVRDLVTLFALALAARADHLIRLARGRRPLQLYEAVRLFERRYVREALHRHRGNMAATARALGIARSTLYELVDDLELERPVRDRGRSPLRSSSES